MKITPYEISVSDDAISDLHHRLKQTRWPERELVADWSQGIPLDYVKEVCEYWLSTYNWREREAALNEFDHFITPIEGCDIHFIHQRSKHDDAVPLILSHGWPGSIVEFQKVIGPLSDPT
ncbi:MAG: epoxide hydrolase N-terminal domain-containing protein, partial [Actinomycetota bacterium]|nr:epoxide hydrolase N-terminal domain-containing protein [Actinomycetota bacterium]